MAKGFDSIKDEIKASHERRKAATSGDFEKRLYFKLDDGDQAIVRFIDEEAVWAKFHEVPRVGQWPELVACLNPDGDGSSCPGCEFELKRKFRGFINLIWRNAPDEEGNVSTDDKVAIWGSGITVFETLDDRHNLFGLASRDWKIERSGSGLDTTYSIAPVTKEEKAPSAADKKLAKNKYDLNPLVQEPTYEDFLKKLNRSEEAEKEPASTASKNPFL